MNAVLRIVFVSLCVLFITYSMQIYTFADRLPLSESFDTEKAASGRLVWQKYNCQSCHQLYGLGGYLGPDLTNVISAKNKGEHFVKGLIRSGSRQMPGFPLSETEMEALIEFLRSTDESGTADPRTFITNISGTIEQHAKQ